MSPSLKRLRESGPEGKRSGSPLFESLNPIDVRQKFLDLFGGKGVSPEGCLDSSFVDRLSPNSENGPASMTLDFADEFVGIPVFPFQDDRGTRCPDGLERAGGQKKTLVHDGGESRKENEPEGSEEKIKPERGGLVVDDVAERENAGQNEGRPMEETACQGAFFIRGEDILFVYHGCRK